MQFIVYFNNKLDANYHKLSAFVSTVLQIHNYKVIMQDHAEHADAGPKTYTLQIFFKRKEN